jgi:hypothetical protein
LKVAATTIQRSAGAVWKGEKVKVVEVTGDGLIVRTASGTLLGLVKDHEVEPM